jgi:hypothetical protein
MSAAQALKAARAAGIELDVDGDDLLWASPKQPPTAVLDLLARHKTGIVRLLRPGGDGWSIEDWQAFFDERAGIAEYDGGLSPRKQKLSRLNIALWNGSCATQFDQCLAAVSAVVAVTSTQALWCHSAWKPADTYGCIRIVGQHGTLPGRPRRLPHCPRWASARTAQSKNNDVKFATAVIAAAAPNETELG